MTWQALRLAGMLVMGALYTVSGAGKFAGPRLFLGSVVDYKMLPMWANELWAATLPGIEVAAGLGLLAGFLVEAVRIRTGSRSFEVALSLDASGTVPRWRVTVDAWVDAAALIAAGLLVLFIVSLSVNLLRGIRMNCGCFDFIGEYIAVLRSSEVTWGTVARDVVMLALVLPVLRRPRA